jgi:GTP cyclohydrolase I
MHDKDLVIQGVALILEGLVGPEWTSDRNYEDTPQRVANFYEEMFHERNFQLTSFQEKHDQMITLRHHIEYTLCPHHLLPVRLDISCAYIPTESVLGLSKLIRLIQTHLEEPILQETITDSLADELMKIDSLHPPLGAAVLVYGDHACMQIRGARTTGDVATSAMRGVFFSNRSSRDEFLDLVRRG